MKVDEKRFENVVILKIVGELDTFTLPSVTEKLDSLVAAGDRQFVLDVLALRFINSSAIGYLIQKTKRIRDEGGDVVLARPGKFLRRTVVTLGLDQFYPVFETVEDALVHFKKGVEAGKLDLGSTESDERLEGAVPVMFRHSVEKGEAEPPNQVGRIVSLYEDGLLFHYKLEGATEPSTVSLDAGRKLKLKFRQPLAATKDHYFEMTVNVKAVKVDEGDEGRRAAVRVVYDDIKEKDQALLDRFVRDQAIWRREVKGK